MVPTPYISPSVKQLIEHAIVFTISAPHPLVPKVGYKLERLLFQLCLLEHEIFMSRGRGSSSLNPAELNDLLKEIEYHMQETQSNAYVAHEISQIRASFIAEFYRTLLVVRSIFRKNLV